MKKNILCFLAVLFLWNMMCVQPVNAELSKINVNLAEIQNIANTGTNTRIKENTGNTGTNSSIKDNTANIENNTGIKDNDANTESNTGIKDNTANTGNNTGIKDNTVNTENNTGIKDNNANTENNTGNSTDTGTNADIMENTTDNTTIKDNESQEEISEIADGLVKLKNKYILYVNGIKIKNKGWHDLSEKMFYVNSKGYVTGKIEKINSTWKYSKYQKKRWKKQKNVWVIVGTKEYYFNSKGFCGRIYNERTKKLSLYSAGKLQTAKKKMVTLADGKLYYFNSKGKKITTAGWRKIANKKYIQIGEEGYIISKLEKFNTIWRLHTYNHNLHKWEMQKDTWEFINNMQYYFDVNGNNTKVYNTVSKKCYDCVDGKRVLVINDIRTIGELTYYFGTRGVLTTSAGLYFTAANQLVKVLENGSVEESITGELQEYRESDGKISSYRVLDDNYIYYYNSEGTLLRKIDKNGKMVALTYDDGPSIYTPLILDVLQKYNSVATFFVVGNRVPSYSSAVKRAYEMGCEIGNHTYSHPILTGISTGSIQEQISKTNSEVQAITGAAPVVMRPPGGGHNETVRAAVNMPLILWSIDTLDWKIRNASSVQTEALKNVKDGDIILMHDLYSTTAQASTEIIPELIRRGYQLVTISELAECRGGMTKGSVYHKFAW